MTMRPTGNPTDAVGVVATADAPDVLSRDTGEPRDNVMIAENDMSDLSGNIFRGACLPCWRINCMLVSAVVVRCFDGQMA